MFMAPLLDAALTPTIARVLGCQQETHDTWTLAIDAGRFDFEPGQFNMLYAFGAGEIPVSLSGDPGDADSLIHTVRAVGSVSQALTRLKPGDPVGLRGPFGTPWPVGEGAGGDILIVAGGLGLAPLRPAIYRLLGERDRFGRITLLYGTRGPEDILFRREVESWGNRPDMRIEVTVDHADTAWRGHVGVVTKLIERAAFDPGRAMALVCGPEIMMRFTARALETAGSAPGKIHLSLERSMKCAVGHCGHCQFGKLLLCRDGAVMSYDQIRSQLTVREL
jgi:NAD(P)H-flavin reductase